VRVIAARFRNWARAQSALRALRDRFGLGADQAETAPLADGEEESPTVLAGQFEEHRLPEIEALIAEQEGEIVADVPKDHTELKD
jgi:hypothetical protein